MQIHTLSVEKKKSQKRVGRGGKRGTTSGKGTKGQGAHNKHKSPLFEGGRTSLLDRMKKARGFKSPKSKRTTLTLGFLEKHFSNGEEVSRESILAKKLFSPKKTIGGFKVVASGSLSKSLSFDAKIRFSDSALDAAKKAGGVVPGKEE